MHQMLKTAIPRRETKTRPREEVLAAIDDRSLAAKSHTKELVKQLLAAGPMPILTALAKPIPGGRRFLSSCLPSSIKYRGVYESFAEARAHAPKGVPLGYDHPEIATGYKDQKFLFSDYPAAFWLGQALQEEPSVLDLGGSVGISFYSWERYFSYPQNLQWVVCEVPAVAMAGARIAFERNEERLHFISHIEQGDGCDCLLASGSLQYLEETFKNCLQRLRQQPRHLIINRIPLHSQRSCVTLQNVRWVVSPYRVFARDPFINDCESLGYKLIDAWTVPDHNCWIPLYPEHSVSTYSGLYFRRIG